MSESKAPPFSELRLSAPGKIFLFGEYAVLAGKRAVVAAVAPRFSLIARSASGAALPFHPESPAGRLLQFARERGAPLLDFEWNDPYAGTGGFGASSAQYALVYAALLKVWPELQPASEIPALREEDWISAWRLYRELAKEEPVPPSGADLAAQWNGGTVAFDPGLPSVASVGSGFDWSRVLVFSAAAQAGRKVATHRHLEELAEQGFPAAHSPLIEALDEATLEGLTALRDGSPEALGAALCHYATTLWQAGLETPQTTEDRQAFSEIGGVLGIKGAGALQADALTLVVDGRTATWTEVMRVARQRGLTLVSDGIRFQEGVQCQS